MTCNSSAPCAGTLWSSPSDARSRKARRMRFDRILKCRRSISERQYEPGLRRAAPNGRGLVLLELRELDVRYGRVHAVCAVSLAIAPGEIVAVLGANGAGKSSTLRAILGAERAAGGSIVFDGEDVTTWSPSRRVRAGLVLVPEGRRIINTLTVHENLLMGAFNRALTRDVSAEI